MNNCDCNQAGIVAPASPFNTATNCKNPPKGLTTVIIPATKGGNAEGQPLAPVMGAYQNTVVVYEKTGSVYLYDGNGVYTNLTGDSILPILEQLQTQMADLSTTVTLTQNDLAQETSTRITTQTDLQTAITALQTALNTETNDRETGSAELTTQLETLQTQVTTNTQDLAAEVTARTDADTALQTSITGLQESKQDLLESGVNVKTINGQSILGEGDIPVEGGGASVTVVQSTGQSTSSVMSQKAVTDALSDGSGVTAVSLSSSDTDNQITLTTTVAGEPDYTRVDTKTINGTSILGIGDIAVGGGTAATFGSKTIPASDTLALGTLTITAGTYLLIGGLGIPNLNTSTTGDDFSFSLQIITANPIQSLNDLISEQSMKLSRNAQASPTPLAAGVCTVTQETTVTLLAINSSSGNPSFTTRSPWLAALPVQL